MRVHFIGICGSGQSAMAIMAKKLGFFVDGCDVNLEGYYYNSLKLNNITVKEGHDKKHLEEVDICAVSPAVLVIDPNNEEVKLAKELGIFMTWQEFVGKYIFKNKKLISVSGTHGKSTTTVMLGNALEKLNADPSVISGTIYKKWNSGCRIGNSNLYVCEADEFNKNFLNYNSDIIVINNLEMDHPETFSSEKELLDAFTMFIKKIKGLKVLVVNGTNYLINQLLRINSDWIKQQDVKVIGFYSENKYEYDYDEEIQYQIIDSIDTGTKFRIIGSNTEFFIPLLGRYNVDNSVCVVSILRTLGYSDDLISGAINEFYGVNRRFELIGTKKGIAIYDDYAHHPTAIRSVLQVCNKIKKRKVWAIFEPHQISRLLLMFNDFSDALSLADFVVITKTYIGREINTDLLPIEGKHWINSIGKEKAFYIENYDDVAKYVCQNIKENDLVIVIGAGESFKISRKILNNL